MARRPTIPVGVRRQIEAIDRQRCAYCRSPMAVGIPMVVEHIARLAARARENAPAHLSLESTP